MGKSRQKRPFITIFGQIFALEKLPFIPDRVYKRSDIHDLFGGSRQSGISPTANHPYIFIFSGARGKQHGYKDQWENKNVFSYTGEGQVGDMTFTRGNLQLREHLSTGKRVFLFEYVRRGYVRFESELEMLEFRYFETHDRTGDLRLGIKFFFKRAGVVLDYPLDLLNMVSQPEDLSSLSFPSIDPSVIYEYRKPDKTERSGLVTTRVGQGAYRQSLLYRWEWRCAVTEFNEPRALIASHIVPWKDATDDQRLDVDNGILLSPDYDALFDRHLITFDDRGKIVLSNTIQESAYNAIGINGKEKLRKQPEGMHTYLVMHQDEFHANERG